MEKPLRMALGALIIQTKFQYSDRELVEQITEKLYIQHFIGLHGYQEEASFDVNTLVVFRKRNTMDMVVEANEAVLSRKDEHKGPPSAWLSSEGHELRNNIVGKSYQVRSNQSPYRVSKR